MFQKAGLDASKPPKTWDEVHAYAQKIKAVTGKPAFFMQEYADTWTNQACVESNGGTMLVEDFTSFPSDNTPLPGAVVANLLHTASFGFMTMERAASGWTITAFDRTGRPLGIKGLPEAGKGPAFAAAVGLLVYPQVAHVEHFEPRAGAAYFATGTDGYFSRVGRWLKESF